MIWTNAFEPVFFSEVFSDPEGAAVEADAGNAADSSGAVEPQFLIFIEIYDSAKKLVINYPVARCARRALEESMKKQVALYARLVENAVVCAAAVAASSVAAHEWAAYESFCAPEELIAEALSRAEEESLRAERQNEMVSFIDFLDHAGGQSDRPVPAAAGRAKNPALCENPAEREIAVFPLLIGALSSSSPGANSGTGKPSQKTFRQ